MWSIANEPESETPEAEDYFRPLFDVAREADPTRPVGFVNVMLAPHGKCRLSKFGDVLMLNATAAGTSTPATWRQPSWPGRRS